VNQIAEKTSGNLEASQPIGLASRRISPRNALDGWLFLLLLGGFLQGVFFGLVEPLVVERSLVVFRLTPFNLFPTDLFLIPLAFVVAVLAPKGRNTSSKSRRTGLLVLWWILCAYGIGLGILHHTPNLSGDAKDMALRSIAAVAFYYIGLQANVGRVLDKIVLVGFALAFLEVSQAFARYLGLPIALYTNSIYGGFVLLLPYGVLLTRFLSGNDKSTSTRLGIVCLALGILAPLAKPVVAAFLLCNLLAAWLTSSRERQGGIIGAVVRVSVVVAAVVFILWLFLFSQGESTAEQHVLRAYLKQNSSAPDLAGGRLSIWKTGIETWRENPIFGVGLGQPLSGHVVIGSTIVFYDILWPHNIAIQFLYQTGLVGSMLLVGIIWGWFRKARSTLKRTVSVHTADGHVYRAIVVFVVTIFFASLYGQVFFSSTGGFLFWACMGLEAALVAKLTASSVSRNASNLTVDQVVTTPGNDRGATR